MRSYKRPQEKPLSEIIEERKNYYMNKLKASLDMVYKSGDLDYIGKFEQALLRLADTGKLEKILKEDTNKDVEEPIKRIKRKPILTIYQYSKSRDEGMTNQQIKEKFSMKSPYVIGGFARQYLARKKNDEKEQKS